jgi:hypothetical protein
MKRLISILLAFFLLLNLAGCDAVAKKFTRKKKETVKMPRFYQPQKYTKKPSPELYKKHYVYWESFQAELVNVLGESHKKDLMCIEQIVSNLRDMQNILDPEKGAELKKHVDRLVSVKDTIEREELSQFNKDSIKSTLEHEERLIRREFVYGKIKDHLKKSFENEPQTK